MDESEKPAPILFECRIVDLWVGLEVSNGDATQPRPHRWASVTISILNCLLAYR